MEPAAVVALVTAITGLAGTFLRARVRARVQRYKAHQASRRDHVRCLPPGSRLLDLGERGVLVEIGPSVTDRERPIDGGE
jgi:hypothetical protein